MKKEARDNTVKALRAAAKALLDQEVSAGMEHDTLLGRLGHMMGEVSSSRTSEYQKILEDMKNSRHPIYMAAVALARLADTSPDRDVRQMAIKAMKQIDALTDMMRKDKKLWATVQANMFAIGPSGLTKLKPIKLIAPAPYYLGASSSPTFIIVTAVSPGSISYIDPYDPKVRRLQRPIADDLIQKGSQTWLAAYKRHQPKLAKQVEQALEGKKPTDFKVKDYDSLTVTVEAKGDETMDDLWYQAEKYGSVGGLKNPKTGEFDIFEIRGRRGSLEAIKKDPKFKNYKVKKETKLKASAPSEVDEQGGPEALLDMEPESFHDDPGLPADGEQLEEAVSELDELLEDEHPALEASRTVTAGLEPKDYAVIAKGYKDLYDYFSEDDPTASPSQQDENDLRAAFYGALAEFAIWSSKGKDGSDRYAQKVRPILSKLKSSNIGTKADYMDPEAVIAAQAKAGGGPFSDTLRSMRPKLLHKLESAVEDPKDRNTGAFSSEQKGYKKALNDATKLRSKADELWFAAMKGDNSSKNFKAAAREYEKAAAAFAKIDQADSYVKEMQHKAQSSKKKALSAATEIEAISQGGKATVNVWLTILQGLLTQYDMRVSRRNPNPYRLGHLLKALGNIEDDLKPHLNSDDPVAIMKLAKSVNRRFIVRDMPPAKKLLKTLDEYMNTGKLPKYPTTRKVRR